MKPVLATLLLLFFAAAAPAQENDSLHFVKAAWNKHKIARKVFLYRHHFNNKDLFKSNQNISYIEVKKAKTRKLHIGYEKQQLLTTSDFGAKYNALAAINGAFFDVKNGGSVNYLRVDNVVIDTNRLNTSSQRTQRALAVVGTDKKGHFRVAKLQQENGWENAFDWPQMLATGPVLGYNGVAEVLEDDKFNTSRHPRTAIGIKKNGNIILLTADGRNANAQGADMWELQKIMRWLGCTSSANLDGGGSVTMWVQGFPDNGVVNYPSDNKKWDHGGQRKVANVIYLE